MGEIVGDVNEVDIANLGGIVGVVDMGVKHGGHDCGGEDGRDVSFVVWGRSSTCSSLSSPSSRAVLLNCSWGWKPNPSSLSEGAKVVETGIFNGTESGIDIFKGAKFNGSESGMFMKDMGMDIDMSGDLGRSKGKED